MDIQPSEIIRLLQPRTGGIELLYDILLYIMFFMALVTLFTMPDKNILPTIIIASVLLMTVIAKMGDRVLDPKEFGSLFINVCMFVLPLIVAGMIRRVKGRPAKAILPSILSGIFGGIYFFLFWVISQRS